MPRFRMPPDAQRRCDEACAAYARASEEVGAHPGTNEDKWPPFIAFDKACDEANRAVDRFLATVPTTAAGVVAACAFVKSHNVDHGNQLDEEHWQLFVTSMARAA